MKTFINPFTIIIGCGILSAIVLIGGENNQESKSLSGTTFDDLMEEKPNYDLIKGPPTNNVSPSEVSVSSEAIKEKGPMMDRIRISLDRTVMAEVPSNASSFIVDIDSKSNMVLKLKSQKEPSDLNLKGAKQKPEKQKQVVNKVEAPTELPSPAPKEVDVEKQVVPEQPSLLDRIRKDPKRIYIDSTLILNDLKFGVLNVSPTLGLEVYVENTSPSNQNYYMPTVRAGGVEGRFDGTYLSPGAKYFGVVPVANLSSASSIDIIFSAKPGGEKKTNIKFNW